MGYGTIAGHPGQERGFLGQCRVAGCLGRARLLQNENTCGSGPGGSVPGSSAVVTVYMYLSYH